MTQPLYFLLMFNNIRQKITNKYTQWIYNKEAIISCKSYALESLHHKLAVLWDQSVVLRTYSWMIKLVHPCNATINMSTFHFSWSCSRIKLSWSTIFTQIYIPCRHFTTELWSLIIIHLLRYTAYYKTISIFLWYNTVNNELIVF